MKEYAKNLFFLYNFDVPHIIPILIAMSTAKTNAGLSKMLLQKGLASALNPYRFIVLYVRTVSKSIKTHALYWRRLKTVSLPEDFFNVNSLARSTEFNVNKIRTRFNIFTLIYSSLFNIRFLYEIVNKKIRSSGVRL